MSKTYRKPKTSDRQSKRQARARAARHVEQFLASRQPRTVQA